MIEIMSESENNLLVIKAIDKLTVQDYEEVLIPRLEKILEEFDKIKGVVYISEGFRGWELGAAWDDAKFGMRHRKDFEKIAIIGGAKWIEWTTKIGSYLISGEVKVYKQDEFNSAIEWVRE